MNIDLRLGSCIDVMATLPENSVDTIITDPPYHLTSITKRFGGKNAAPAQFGTDGAFARASKGFMGKTWDGGDVAFQVATWEQAYRVLKPGGFLLAFGGTRTYHRMVCAIEDAGFEIRDTIAWVYGSGFPKSYDISKGIDKQSGAEREVVGIKRHARDGDVSGQKWTKENTHNGSDWDMGSNDRYMQLTAPSTPEAQLWHGWGTALKPAFEPIVVAMKPVDGNFVNNALTWGVAGMWIDGGRIEANPKDYDITRKSRVRKNGVESKDYILAGGWKATENAIVDTQPTGRYPANFIHDGSEEVMELFPETGVSSGGRIGNKGSALNMMGTNFQAGDPGYGDSGSAARFFYCAKASRSERNAGLEGLPDKERTDYGGFHSEQGLINNNRKPENRVPMQNGHPTVKPIELMRYLVRLTKTPTGGVVLDPFMGSGTTGMACVKEGRNFIGIELDEEYLEIAKKRIEHAQAECTQLSIDNLDEEQSACC